MRILTGSFWRQYNGRLIPYFTDEKIYSQAKKVLGTFPKALAVSRYQLRGHDLKLLKTDTLFSTHVFRFLFSSFCCRCFFLADYSAKPATNRGCNDRYVFLKRTPSLRKWYLSRKHRLLFSCYVLQFTSTPWKLTMLHFPESESRLQLPFHSLHLSPSYICTWIFQVVVVVNHYVHSHLRREWFVRECIW